MTDLIKSLNELTSESRCFDREIAFLNRDLDEIEKSIVSLDLEFLELENYEIDRYEDVTVFFAWGRSNIFIDESRVLLYQRNHITDSRIMMKSFRHAEIYYRLKYNEKLSGYVEHLKNLIIKQKQRISDNGLGVITISCSKESV